MSTLFAIVVWFSSFYRKKVHFIQLYVENNIVNFSSSRCGQSAFFFDDLWKTCFKAEEQNANMANQNSILTYSLPVLCSVYVEIIDGLRVNQHKMIF